jgi:hypothetical protein
MLLLVGVALAVTLLAKGFAIGNPIAGLVAAFAVLFVAANAAVPASALQRQNLCAPTLPIPENYIRMFSATWEHTVQQEVAKMSGTVTVDAFDGKEKVYTDIGQASFTERRGRLSKTELKEILSAKRKMTKREFSAHHIFDRSDKQFLAMLGEPTSELQAELKYAFNRSIDEGIAAAASATVYGGADPYVTPITLPATQQVAVGYVPNQAAAVNSGLTPHKLIEAIRIIQGNDLSLTSDPFVLVISPRQVQDLFQYITTSPNDVYATMIGEFIKDNNKPLMGFRVIVSNRLTVASNIRTCLAFSKKGIYMSPDKLEIKIVERADLEFARQVSAMGEWGFMRRWEEHVIEIYCDEDLSA